MFAKIQELLQTIQNQFLIGAMIRGVLVAQAMRVPPCIPEEWDRRVASRRILNQRGSAILVAMILMTILSLLGLAFALTAITDSAISNSNRQGLNTYYIAEAGTEEALNQIVTTPRTQFNPTSFTGSFPVDVTQCFYNDSRAPSCPVTVGSGASSSLVSVPVSVGAGSYRVSVQYLGRSTDAASMTLNKYLVFSTAALNASGYKSSQTTASTLYAEEVEFAFPPHPITSCTEPTGSGPWRAKGLVKPFPPETIDPSAPSQWPGTTDPNYGTTPLCTLPYSTRVQQAIQINADYSYPSGTSDSSPLPPQFWKVAPTGGDPRTGEPYKVYVNGDLTVNGNVTIYGVYYVTRNVTFNGTANLQGIIYAPNGTFTGHGGGNPSNAQGTGSIYANAISATGNHYKVVYEPSYANAYLGQIPYRMSRGGR